eukprot:gnl/TRDRNA2_/TRDRNA2_41619_c0_seq1.p1 gnl/TRDRNA2_/TRDRNA2_41619_c0~~gnl/TRDRNA2_/TRDRNA2_41619_c0_seq1.p1  ORF type:complete len:293 (+),score=37.84 gnl/TRDRNA2_/TRDRNA2_41619_c0_seq1:75-881(+)
MTSSPAASEVKSEGEEIPSPTFSSSTRRRRSGDLAPWGEDSMSCGASNVDCSPCSSDALEDCVGLEIVHKPMVSVVRGSLCVTPIRDFVDVRRPPPPVAPVDPRGPWADVEAAGPYADSPASSVQWTPSTKRPYVAGTSPCGSVREDSLIDEDIVIADACRHEESLSMKPAVVPEEIVEPEETAVNSAAPVAPAVPAEEITCLASPLHSQPRTPTAVFAEPRMCGDVSSGGRCGGAGRAGATLHFAGGGKSHTRLGISERVRCSKASF